MKLFVIHRFKDNKSAKKILKQISKEHCLQLQPFLLNSYGMTHWKEKALREIYKSEAVIIFNPSSCMESENTRWEIEKAHEAKKEIVEINEIDYKDSISKLLSIYNMCNRHKRL